MEIDPKLKREIEATGDAEADMVVGCSDYNATVRAAIERMGMRVLSEASKDLGLITIKGRLGDVPRLASIPQLRSVELDSEQSAFD